MNFYTKAETGRESYDRNSIEEILKIYYKSDDLTKIEGLLKQDVRNSDKLYHLLKHTRYSLTDFLVVTSKIFDDLYDKSTIRRIKKNLQYLESLNNIEMRNTE